MSDKERRVYCRRAEVGDRARIGEFIAELEEAAGPDYLRDVIDEWLVERPGGVYVATVDATVAGMAATTFPGPMEAWFQGMRVLPRFWRTGVGGELAAYQLNEAMANGARVARLAVAPDNVKAQKMVEERLGLVRERQWSVAAYPLTELTAGRRPMVVKGPVAEQALRFLKGRRMTLACAWPDPWVVASYRLAVARAAAGGPERRLLMWLGEDGPLMVCHIGVCGHADERMVLVDLAAAAASRTEIEECGAGLLGAASELARAEGAKELMISLPSRLFAPIRSAARWLGMNADGNRQWRYDVYQTK